MPNRRNINPPRRFADENDVYYDAPSQRQHRGPRCTIPAFPDKLKFIEYNPNHPPAAFPSTDWLKENSLPQLNSSNEQSVESLDYGEVLSTDCPRTEKPTQAIADRSVDSTLSFDSHNDNDSTGIWGTNFVSSRTARDDPSNQSRRVMEDTDISGAADPYADYQLPGMDTSDDEEAEKRQVQWSDVQPSLQARICANLARMNRVSPESAIQVLPLNSAEARLALQYYRERETQIAQEEDVSELIVQDQLNALLRGDGTSSLQEDQRQQVQLFERHMRGTKLLSNNDYLAHSSKDLAKAEEYLSNLHLGVQLATTDLATKALHDGSIARVAQGTPSSTQLQKQVKRSEYFPALSANTPRTVAGASTAQVDRNVQNRSEETAGRGTSRLQPRVLQPQIVDTTSSNSPFEILAIRSASSTEASSAGDGSSGRRMGLRTGRERRLTERAREAIESGMSIPGGHGRARFLDQSEENDENYVPDDADADSGDSADVPETRNESSPPGKRVVNLKLKLNNNGEMVVRKHGPPREQIEDGLTTVRKGGTAENAILNSSIQGHRGNINRPIRAAGNLEDTLIIPQRRDSQTQSPVMRQVVSRQGSPLRPRFSILTQEDMEHISTSLTEQSSNRSTPLSSSLTVDHQGGNFKSAERHVSVNGIPSSPSRKPQIFQSSSALPSNQPTASMNLPSGSQKEADRSTTHLSSHDSYNHLSLPSSHPLAHQQVEAASGFKALNNFQKQSSEDHPEGSTSQVLASQHPCPNYEQFTFPFVESNDIQKENESHRPQDEPADVETLLRESPHILVTDLNQRQLSRSAISEGPEQRAGPQSHATRVIPRAYSEPPQTPTRAEMSTSHAGGKPIGQFYSDIQIKSNTSSSKTLSNRPFTGKSTLSTNSLLKAQLETPTPLPRQQKTAKPLSRDSVDPAESVQASNLVKKNSSTPGSLTPNQTSATVRQSSVTDGWQPESIEMAKKAGLLVNSEEGYSSTKVTSFAKLNEPSSSAVQTPLVPKTPLPLRKRKLQLSSKTSKLEDGSVETNKGNRLSSNDLLDIASIASRTTSVNDPKMAHVPPYGSLRGIGAQKSDQIRVRPSQNLGASILEPSFQDTPLQTITSSDPAKSSWKQPKGQEKPSDTTIEGDAAPSDIKRSPTSSPDPIVSPTPAPRAKSKHKSNAKKRSGSQISLRSNTGVSPPRKVAATEKGISTGIKVPSATFQKKTLVQETDTDESPASSPKNNAHKRAHSNNSLSSTIEAIPHAKALTAATGLTKKKLRSSKDASSDSVVVNPSEDKLTLTAMGASSPTGGTSDSTPSSSRSKTSTSKASMPPSKKKSMSELVAKTTKTTLAPAPVTDSPVATRTRGRMATPATATPTTASDEASASESSKPEATVTKARDTKKGTPAPSTMTTRGKATKAAANERSEDSSAGSAATETSPPPPPPPKKRSMATRRKGGRVSERVEID